MEDTIIRSIVEIESEDAVLLGQVAKTLGCSNTRALQFAIDQTFGIRTHASNRGQVNFRDAKIERLFIPMTLEQKKERMKIEYQRKATFVDLCSEAIRTVHQNIEDFAKQQTNQVLWRYLPKLKQNIKKRIT